MILSRIKSLWLRHEPASLAFLLFTSGVILGVMGAGIQHRDDMAHVALAYGEASASKDALISEQGQRIADLAKRYDQLSGRIEKTATKAAKAATDAKAAAADASQAVDSIPTKKKHWWSK